MSAGCGASGSGSRSVSTSRRSRRPRPADRLQPGGQWQRAVDRLRRVERAVDERRADEELRRRWPEREAPVEADGDRRQQLAVRPGEDRPRRVVVGPGVDDPPDPDRLVARIAREDDRPLAAAPPGSSSRTARGCARRGGRRARRRSAGSGSSRRGRPGAGPAARRRATGRGARPRVASRRSTGRRRRRRRRGSPAPRGAARAGAGPGRGPAPRRRGDARTGSRHAPEDRRRPIRGAPAPGPRGRRSRARPSPATARSYSTNVRAVGPASSSAATSSAVTPRSSFRREIAVSSARQPAGPAAGATWRRIAIRSTSGSTTAPESRRISRPSAWNVRTRTAPASTPSGASADASRSRSSSAARVLNVIAAISPGVAVPESISHATRATSVVVLPLPAGATQSRGPGGAVAAARWSGASRASRSATDGWSSIGRPWRSPLDAGSPRSHPRLTRPTTRIGAPAHRPNVAPRDTRKGSLTIRRRSRYRGGPSSFGAVQGG